MVSDFLEEMVSTEKSNTESSTEEGTTTRDMKIVLPPLLLLIILTSAANIVVMLCTRVDAKLKAAHSNMYVFSLAIADFLVGFLVMPAMSVYTVAGLWPLGDVTCTVWIAVDFTCCTVSILHLCLIAYDRQVALTNPLEYKTPNRKRYVLMGIGFAWAGSAMAWLPAVLYFRSSMEPVPLDCFFVPHPTFLIIHATLVYYLPILVMIYFYVKCLHGLSARYRKVQEMTNQRNPRGDHGGQLGCGPTRKTTTATKVTVKEASITKDKRTTANGAESDGSFISSSEKRRQEHVGSIRTLGVIILMFLFCWLPFCLFWPIAAFCDSCISPEWYEYSYWAAYLNSTFNPFLYFVCMKDFRRAFRLLLIKAFPCIK